MKWLDALVESEAAVLTRGNGYPTEYVARAAEVIPILSAPPEARATWVHGAQDVVTDKWVGHTAVDTTSTSGLNGDEWLLVEAWDES